MRFIKENFDPIILLSFISTLIIAFFISLIWGIYINDLPSQLPIFYSLPWGESQLVSKTQFVILPSIVVLVVLTNMIISWHLHNSQLVIKRILSVMSFLVALLILVTALRTIFIFI